MQVEVFALGMLQTNCYILWQEGRSDCVIIDPGQNDAKIMEKVRSLGKQVAGILLTHGHFDHVGGVRALAEETGCPVYIHAEELSLPQNITAGPLYYTHLYEETVSLAGMDFYVMHTPGHTPGSVCLFSADAVFAGDTLFAGTCGRTDLPGSSPTDMAASLKKLRAYPGNCTVYSGHGWPTTLEEERKNNPYMR